MLEESTYLPQQVHTDQSIKRRQPANSNASNTELVNGITVSKNMIKHAPSIAYTKYKFHLL